MLVWYNKILPCCCRSEWSESKEGKKVCALAYWGPAFGTTFSKHRIRDWTRAPAKTEFTAPHERPNWAANQPLEWPAKVVTLPVFPLWSYKRKCPRKKANRWASLLFLLDGKIHCPHSTNQFDTLTLGGVIYALEVNNKGNLVVPRAEVARN